MPSRRRFLQQSSSFLAASILAPHFLTAQSFTRRPVGIQLFTLMGKFDQDVKGNLQKIADLGYTEIESAFSGLSGFYGMPGKVLQIDGDKDYLKICLDVYTELGIGLHKLLTDRLQYTEYEAECVLMSNPILIESHTDSSTANQISNIIRDRVSLPEGVEVKTIETPIIRKASNKLDPGMVYIPVYTKYTAR